MDKDAFRRGLGLAMFKLLLCEFDKTTDKVFPHPPSKQPVSYVEGSVRSATLVSRMRYFR